MKSAVLSQLNADHRNIAWLLKLVDRETELVQRAEPANLELLLDIMRYMTRYPDQVHHRLEDLMFQSLLERVPQTHTTLDRMFAEHEELAKRGQAFHDTLQNVVDGALVERESLVSDGRDYCALLRGHMTYENETVYPLAEQSLDDRDWAQIADLFAAQKDPVFGPIKDADFDNLLTVIRQESKQ